MLDSRTTKLATLRSLGVIAVLGLGFSLAACSSVPVSLEPASGDSEPSSSESQGDEATSEPEEELDSEEGSFSASLKFSVGDCLDFTSASPKVMDCSEPHDTEVYYLDTVDAATMPDEATMDADAEELCATAFEDYVGISYDDSEYYLTYATPNAETWAGGDREIVCFLESDMTTGSLQGVQQ